MYMTQGLHRALQQRPGAVAVRCGEHSLTFRQLGARVARLAGGLRHLGVADGERVAMLSLNSARYLEYNLAVPWAGGVLNPVNIRWSQAEMLYALNDSGTRILIVDDTFKGMAAALQAGAASLRHLIYAGDGPVPDGMIGWEALVEASEPVEDAWRHGDDLAGIFYTGGTTGFPKGVMLSHANLTTTAMASILAGRCGAEAVFLHVMPMFHLAAFAATNALFASGARQVVMPGFTPQSALEAISRERINQIGLAPTMIQMLVDWMAASSAEAARLDASSLRLIAYGASPISQTLLQRARTAFPGVAFMQGYGMTELSATCTVLGPEYHDDAAFASGKARAAGKPLMSVEVRVVGPDGAELPRREVGEIVARGGTVMLGYWNKPDATAEVLRNGWMHTGDSGYMDEEGLVYVVDRLKDMIVTGAENVYSAEVENALASHPAVAFCAVIGVPNQKWGESVHAVIVRKPGASASAEEIIAHCRERIAGYKCPRSVEFRDALPLSSVGKVLKNELRKPFWSGEARSVA
ncbi:long-chain-fatty-acid--CoA ligase [Cupriavidus numazuensis]|uniref:Long-chain-fatty-acid--CoA ligase n=1 Tax=Cupriavidus numazuensis TaxID=221992 RepID=A0ABN7QAF6_9BURK|nr:long-chain-fatty-acid--CoA ligase [Cupriavidus numazuensis]CAG2159291.1 Long-chain-fatty-acid--CoA ligase [Cupriavidus numazuensis]